MYGSQLWPRMPAKAYKGNKEACLYLRGHGLVQGHSAALQQHLQQQPMLTLNMGPQMAAHLAQLPASQPPPAEVRLPTLHRPEGRLCCKVATSMLHMNACLGCMNIYRLHVTVSMQKIVMASIAGFNDLRAFVVGNG